MSDYNMAPTLPDGEVRAGQVLYDRFKLVAKRGQHDDISRWDGWDQRLDRQVVLYIIPVNHPRADTLLWAAKQAGAATDGHFLRVLDARPFDPMESMSLIVCEDCVGVTLQHLLRDGPLPGLDAAWLTCEVASALAPLHEMGLCHGALNPATVILTQTGDVRIQGFMLFAAFAGRIDHDPAVRERADVAAIGRLLYASLTGAWPDVATPDPPQTYGLPPAQWRDNRLLSPTVAQPGVSPILDAVCMQTIQPREGAAPLRTADAVSLALRRALGNVNPTADLAARVCAALAKPSDDQPSETSTGQTPAVTPQRPNPMPVDEDQTHQVPVGSRRPPAPSGGARKSSKSAMLPPPRFTKRLPRWWWAALVLVVALVIFLVARACSAPPPPPTPQAIDIAAITELDAVADGGDSKDHPDQVPLATDGDSTTCWTSEVYATGYIPTNKPGIGLVFDLASSKSLASMTITFGAVPISYSIMVPNDQTVDAPPLDTVQSWSSLADVTSREMTVTLNLPANTTTRFVMLYFTNLPAAVDKDNRVQASVCEVTATG